MQIDALVTLEEVVRTLEAGVLDIAVEVAEADSVEDVVAVSTRIAEDEATWEVEETVVLDGVTSLDSGLDDVAGALDAAIEDDEDGVLAGATEDDEDGLGRTSDDDGDEVLNGATGDDADTALQFPKPDWQPVPQ
jgi:hypothetical protein